MAVSEYMIKEVITLRPSNSFEDAINLFEKENIRWVPVIDENGILKGTFSLHTILTQTVPFAAKTDRTVSLNFFIQGIDYIREKYHAIKDLTIGNHLDKETIKIHAGMHFMEVLNVLLHNGSPVSVVEQKTDKLLGIFTYQEALKIIRSKK
jgi:predicted transcriptional regulator